MWPSFLVDKKVRKYIEEEENPSVLDIIIIHFLTTIINTFFYGYLIAVVTASMSGNASYPWVYFIIGGLFSFLTMIAPSGETSLVAQSEALVVYVFMLVVISYYPSLLEPISYILFAIMGLSFFIQLYFLKNGTWNGKEISEISENIVVNPKATTIRPWVRWFARIIDYTVWALIFSFAFFSSIAIVIPHSYYTIVSFFNNSMLFTILIMASWIPVEAFLLSNFGTTIGKWLLNTSITKYSGAKLSYSNALKRSGLVYLSGVALGLPIFSQLAMVASFVHLRNNESTIWDTNVNSFVCHSKLVWWRSGVAIVIVIASWAILYF
jgi:uncharacterized RDD family membrane protein YckC